MNLIYILPFFITGLFQETPPGIDAEEIRWRVVKRDVRAIQDNAVLALVDPENGWVGGSYKDKPSRNMVLRLVDGQWTEQGEVPWESARMTVLDADPQGHLWICLFGMDPETTYGGLRVARYNGASWSLETASPGIFPQAMDMLEDGEGWIGGNHGLFLHRVGGRWTRVHLLLEEEAREGLNVLDMKMYHKDNGWAVGQRGLLARWLHGEWRFITATPALRKMSFRGVAPVAEDEAWVVDLQGNILHFVGDNWTLSRSPTPGLVSDIHMLSREEGWIVGSPSLLLRYDGSTWREQNLPGVYQVTDIHMFGPDEGWIVGPGVILKATTERPTIQLTESTDTTLLKRSSNYAASLDLDGDGDPDLITAGEDGALIFHQNHQGFKERPLLDSPPRTVFESNTFAFADVDGDLDLDLLWWSWKPEGNLLFRNKGDGRFEGPEIWNAGETEIVAAAKMSFSDVNGDGYLDLYVTRSGTLSPAPISNLLYLNDGTGHFTLTPHFSGDLGGDDYALWGDLDGDGREDLITPTYFQKNTQMYLNRDGRLTEVPRGVETVEDEGGENRQGCLADLDVDGDLDLLFFNGGLRVFENNEGRLTPVDHWFPALENREYGRVQMMATGDLNHNGRPEILLQTMENKQERVRLFTWKEGRYQDVAEETGIADLTGFAAVFEDWDGDGDLDLFIARGYRGHDVLLDNEHNGGNYLKVKPRGVLQNRGGAGARVWIYEAGGLDPSPKGFQALSLGAQAPKQRLHFGLDSNGEYHIRVAFPGGREVVRRNVSPGSVVTIHEYPSGLRHVLLARRFLERLIRQVDPVLEGFKLLVALGLILMTAYTGPKLGARLLVRRAVVLTPVLCAYLLACGYGVGKTGVAYVWGPLMGLLPVMGWLLWLDRRLTRKREANHIGHYQLLGQLGTGGMGVVYRAQNLVTGRLTALKALSPSLFSSETARSRFLREASIMKQLDHPNIVAILEAGEADDCCWLSMELLRGKTLEDLTKPEPSLVLDLAEGICRALAYIHQKGVVHRDLKCENIFVTDQKDRRGADRVKLMDFGLSRAADMQTLTLNPGVMGTLAYMSPEQASGLEATRAADIYALGVVLYHLLSGAFPYQAENDMQLLCKIRDGVHRPLGEIAPHVSKDLERVVTRMLQQKPEDRYPNVEAVAQALALVPEAGNGFKPMATEVSAPAPQPQPEIPTEADPLPPQTGEMVEEVGETLDALSGYLPEDPAHLQKDPEEKWRQCWVEANRLEAQGRSSEAQVMRMVFLENLEQILSAMGPEERAIYLKQHELEEMLGSVSQ